MARPRWTAPLTRRRSSLALGWDRFVALWAALNLLWVAFDITYVPLRTFWLQRRLYPLPSVPLAVPLTALPNITPWVDPIKGIEPHRETQAYLAQFEALDRSLQAAPFSRASAGSSADVTAATASQRQALQRQLELTHQLIDSNPFLASGSTGTLEKIKNRLRQRADRDSAKQAASVLLDPAWLQARGWAEERRFWRQQVLPLVATNYWRSIDENGRPTDHFWRFDLLLFQSVFAFDIALKVWMLKRRLPGLSWQQALLRRWTDLPLLLPFWRWLRLLPVLERLHSARLISVEPLRAVVSRAVVALLAVELFEVLALQLLDGFQQVIRSPRWPHRFRALRSHQSIPVSEERELVELVRIWGPLLLSQVAPRLAPELQGVMTHALQQTLQSSMVPPPLRQLQPLLQVEQGISRQLAVGVVESLLELARTTGERLRRRDDVQLDLLQRCIDRFWEELAMALERGPVLERSQELLCALLEELKRSYLSQISRSGIDALILELDQIITTAPGTGGSSAGMPSSSAAAAEGEPITSPAGAATPHS